LTWLIMLLVIGILRAGEPLNISDIGVQ